MTQTIGIESIGSRDPAVETWGEILPTIAEAFAAGQEKAKALVSGAGKAVLASLNEIA